MYSSYSLFSTVIYPLLQPSVLLDYLPLTVCLNLCTSSDTGLEYDLNWSPVPDRRQAGDILGTPTMEDKARTNTVC